MLTQPNAATLPKAYEPEAFESTVMTAWDAARAFHAEPGTSKPPYCIVIPPPNVTAALHLGHAFNNTIQDILTRYHRMRGFETLWMPGTDHAGIATQAVVDKRLQSEGKPALKEHKAMESRGENGREKFIAQVQTWKDEYEATITDQLKLMGCSCDWERQRFTMDEQCVRAVREAFSRLFKDGLIYRGKRLVNWDPLTQTALADDEVEMEEVQGHMYYLRYPVISSESQPSGSGVNFVTVATTRPETMLGDVAVAMNPKDPRAKELVGKSLRLPIVGRVIPIIEDNYVVLPRSMGGDPKDAKSEFATGFLKVTPAHDQNDWDIGTRHALPVINIFGPDATVSRDHGWDDFDDCLASGDREGADPAFLQSLLGLSREEARKQVVAWFKDHDLLEDVKDYTHSVGHSYRSHAAIEPYLSDQWYVKVTDDALVGAAQRALSDGALTFHPERYAKTYSAWHENLRDWCISRQLWWGHRIPVWSKTGMTDHEADDACEDLRTTLEVGTHAANERFMWRKVQEGSQYAVYACLVDVPEHVIREVIEKGYGFAQDPDVLDTWFSSGLWPLSTMGWPEDTDLLATFNPTNVLCTAREIITLWVSRMVMFNRYFTPDHRVPFRDVYIHPMIQDGYGQKMSKSLGNGVDPRDIIHTHGADALRFTLAQMATATQDVRLPVDVMCPHCEHVFDAATITTPAGHRVAAPTLKCPSCSRNMTSGFGNASGAATPTDDAPLARNTSSKFDIGRAFCNKLWNAVRFAISNLDHVGSADRTLTLPDRWMLTRLHRAVHRIEDAVAAYQVNTYADAIYDLARRDFCDWYLEAIKPTIQSSPQQQIVLRCVLDSILRLLHPICPFITETLWPHVRSKQNDANATIPGITLGPSDLLATAPWPDIACSIEDASGHDAFERIRNLVEAIRALRGEHKVPDKRRITLCASPDVFDLINSSGPVAAALAGLETIKPFDRSAAESGDQVVVFTFEGQEQLLLDLAEAADPAVERARLEQEVTALEKSIAALSGRLNNPGYAQKAPEKLVNETRQQLADAERERTLKQAAIDRLGR